MAVLARMLSPDDFGRMAMILGIAGLAFILGDFGLGLAAVQAKTLTDPVRAKLFWISTALGAAGTAAVAALAYPIALIFDDPALLQGTLVVAPVFLFTGASTQYRAHLTREQRVLALAFCEVAGQVCGVVGGVLAVIGGAGYLGLALQQLVAAVGAFALLAVASGWLPRDPAWKTPTRDLATFGRAASATQIANYLSVNAPTVALGRYASATEAGFYSRGYQLFTLPLQQVFSPLTRVVLPTLSTKHHEGNPLSFERSVTQLQTACSWAGVCLIAGLYVTAPEVVSLLLGSGWERTVPVLRALLVGGVLQVVTYPYYWAFLARAEVRSLALAELPGRLTMIGATAATAYLGAGAVEVAWINSSGLAIIFLATSYLAGRRLFTSRLTPIRIVMAPMLFFAACAVVNTGLVEPYVQQREGAVGLTMRAATLMGILALFMIHPGTRRSAGSSFRLLRPTSETGTT